VGQPYISVIVSAYNRRRHLTFALRSLVRGSPIIIDIDRPLMLVKNNMSVADLST
jgi:hypothetical protein